VAAFPGLELLATAVVALDDKFVVRYANPAAENLLATGARSLIGQPFLQLFSEKEDLEKTLVEARSTHWDYSAQNITYTRIGHEPLPLSCVVARIEAQGLALIAELRPIEQQLRMAREERLVFEQQANRELIRNLAHEIRNPLAGIGTSAQVVPAANLPLIVRRLHGADDANEGHADLKILHDRAPHEDEYLGRDDTCFAFAPQPFLVGFGERCRDLRDGVLVFAERLPSYEGFLADDIRLFFCARSEHDAEKNAGRDEKKERPS